MGCNVEVKGSDVGDGVLAQRDKSFRGLRLAEQNRLFPKDQCASVCFRSVVVPLRELSK